MTEIKTPSCYKCGSEENLFRIKTHYGKYTQYLCNSCNSVAKKRYYDDGKTLVLNHYGRKCVCCGETIEAFLSIDHINNNGTEDRWPNGNRITGVHLYRKLVTAGFPDGYQVLCMNCNFGKRMNGGVCPHKTA